MDIKASVTFLFDHDGASLEIRDDTSFVTFFRCKFTAEQACQLMSRLGNTHTKSASVNGLERVGLKSEHTKLEFPIPKDIPWKEREEVARTLSKDYCPEGWIPDGTFGSQNSFFTRDGVPHARCTIRRWVPVEDSPVPSEDDGTTLRKALGERMMLKDNRKKKGGAK